jgi:DNA-binding NarL/FixJ family response regulator
MSELTKVMIVDDHTSIRNLFEKEFTPENGFIIVESIGNAAEAVAFCTLTLPDLVIMDVCTENGASGLDAAGKILERFPNIKVIMTSGFDEVTYMPRAMEIGAHAFVYKIKSVEYYREVAKRVLNGEYVFPEAKTIPLPQGETPFTDREMEVLRLLCGCLAPQQIAEELSISPKTVNRHIENMKEKAGMKSAMELMTYVLSNGWINPNY